MSLDDEILEEWDWWDGSSGSKIPYSAFRSGYRACYERHVKPAKKVIDLSVVAGSNIPMLFGDSMPRDWRRSGFLIEYRQSDRASYYDGYVAWRRCKFDTTRPVAWFGGECPFPEGVRVKVWCRDGDFFETTPDELEWKHGLDEADDIIAFQVKGLVEGWRYPWEVSNE